MALQITPALAQWLQTCMERGHDRATVLTALRANGYDRNMAERICAQAFGQPGKLKQAATPTQAPITALDHGDLANWFVPAWPLVGGRRNRIPADHGDIRVLARSERPYVVTLGNVLTKEECAELIDYARPRLKRALVVSKTDGDGEIDPRRTSEEAAIMLGETPLVARIDARIREFTGLPISHGEGLLVMRYGIGAEYQPHFDFFDQAQPGEYSHLQHGQRMATLVMYLNDVEAGGETAFPDADIEVLPHTGNAVYFAYTDAEGRCDKLSYHGGAPVTRGEKWIATKWLRDRPYYAA